MHNYTTITTNTISNNNNQYYYQIYTDKIISIARTILSDVR